jgi:hypothetical protein
MAMIRAAKHLIPMLACAALLVAACGDDDDGAGADAAANLADATSSIDGGGIDAASSADASSSADANTAADAMVGPDADPSACHGLGFGAAAVSLEQVGTLPAMTGGTIPLGAYDAVAFKMKTSTTTGTYRGSWYFEGGNVLKLVQQITLAGSPPPATPRTFSYGTAGTVLTRTETCPGTMVFSNGYTVRTEAGGTFLDVRQNTIMFTFKKRP